MVYITPMDAAFVERSITGGLVNSISERPVTGLIGSRQSGKSTLVRRILNETGREDAYFTFDDPRVLDSALSDPVTFIDALPEFAVLDEIQRALDILPAIKLAVDRDRRPGAFVLTGSANVLLLPRLAESLVGRMAVRRLWTLSQSEIAGRPAENFAERAFGDGVGPERAPAQDSRALSLDELRKVMPKGGYPEIIASSMRERSRERWFQDFIDTLLARDVRDIAEIDNPHEMVRLLTVLAGRAGTVANVAALARDIGWPQSTLRRRLALLEALFVFVSVPAWHRKTERRMVKAPKLVMPDSGLHAHLAGPRVLATEREGGIVGRSLENFVGGELLRACDYANPRLGLFHYRTYSGLEVDYVIEHSDGRVFGIEVKSSPSPASDDFRGLRALAEDVGDQFAGGVVLHTGESVLTFGRDLFALPVSAVWNPSS